MGIDSLDQCIFDVRVLFSPSSKELGDVSSHVRAREDRVRILRQRLGAGELHGLRCVPSLHWFPLTEVVRPVRAPNRALTGDRETGQEDQSGIQLATYDNERLTRSSPVLAAGTRLSHYEIVCLVGRGGFADVYRARDVRWRSRWLGSSSPTSA